MTADAITEPRRKTSHTRQHLPGIGMVNLKEIPFRFPDAAAGVEGLADPGIFLWTDMIKRQNAEIMQTAANRSFFRERWRNSPCDQLADAGNV